MSIRRSTRLFASVICAPAILFLLGCGQRGTDEKPKEFSTAAAKDVLLAEEPKGGVGVLEMKKKAKDKDEVVVIGRVGGSTKPMTPGYASFTIVDASFVPCSERGDDGCTTPWDYCCDDPTDLKQGTLLVKVVDREGRTVEQGADSFLGIKPLQTLVVRGKLQRDEGSIQLVAQGIYFKK